MTVDAIPEPTAGAWTEQTVARARGRGRSDNGHVEAELDGTGALVDVVISPAAMAGNRGSLERDMTQAHGRARAAANEALERALADVPALAEQQQAFQRQAEDLAAEAMARIDAVVAALEGSASRRQAHDR